MLLTACFIGVPIPTKRTTIAIAGREDFNSLQEALADYAKDPTDPSVAFIEIDGLTDAELQDLGLTRVRPNPIHRPSKRKTGIDREWQREIANEAGMLHGVDAKASLLAELALHNEAMGWD